MISNVIERETTKKGRRTSSLQTRSKTTRRPQDHQRTFWEPPEDLSDPGTLSLMKRKSYSRYFFAVSSQSNQRTPTNPRTINVHDYTGADFTSLQTHFPDSLTLPFFTLHYVKFLHALCWNYIVRHVISKRTSRQAFVVYFLLFFPPTTHPPLLSPYFCNNTFIYFLIKVEKFLCLVIKEKKKEKKRKKPLFFIPPFSSRISLLKV